jgi:hypothetical protein
MFMMVNPYFATYLICWGFFIAMFVWTLSGTLTRGETLDFALSIIHVMSRETPKLEPLGCRR